MSDITKRLEELREINGLNKKEFADKLGINRSATSRWESGEIKPTLDNLILISRTFNVSLDWLAGFGNNYEYEKIIQKCINSGISKEKLNKLLDIIGEDK